MQSDSSSVDAITTELSRHLLKQFPNLTPPGRMIQGFEHEPPVNKTVQPVAQPMRRVPVAYREATEKELKRMESEDVLEKIDSSPWVSNMVLQWKDKGRGDL